MSLNFKQVAIIGAGHIGASVGIALKKRGFGGKIVGLGRSRKNLEDALRIGCIDVMEMEPGAFLRESDLVVLCTPVRSIPEWTKRLRNFFPGNVYITDAGSVKGIIASVAQRAGFGSNFVPAHPIAGTEKSGALSADPELFNGRMCILTPLAENSPAAIKAVREFWKFIGCRVVEMLPDEHDSILGLVSHLPHAVAYCLVSAVKIAGGQKAIDLAGGGLRDYTRIAASSPEMWRDIFLSNKKKVLRSIKIFQKELKGLSDAIADNKDNEIMEFLSGIREFKKKMIPPNG